MGLDSWRPKQSKEEEEKRIAFGHDVRRIRKEKGLSISVMAEKIGVSEELMVRIENGKVSPDIPRLQSKLSHLKDRRNLVIS
ncbi:helix-turn-helix transcriptional regulator [Peribacillus castrilensis]|uniref:helix-turn-helix domain-containing protein n=1 Tax=Peribacillus castrilensis TaxID=2897690 RepID=UPI003D2B4B7E